MLLREKGEMEEKSVETKVNSKSVKKGGGGLRAMMSGCLASLLLYEMVREKQ